MASLEQKIQAKMDELNALKEKQRKKENQEKIIIGALVIKEAQTNPEFAKQLLSIISKASERDRKKVDAVTKNFAQPSNPWADSLKEFADEFRYMLQD